MNIRDIKNIIISASIISIFLFFLSGCNSKGYEIEEVEDYTDTSSSAKNEIKQNIENQQNEIKDTLTARTQVTITYTIQIGAFQNESNASLFTRNAKSELPYDIDYKLIQGLYKVRLGNYVKLDETYNVLTRVREAGFEDAFVIEIRK